MRIPNLATSKSRNDDDRTMTPMIDVVFLLLIFFVCASLGQVRESVLPSELGGGVISSETPKAENEIVERVFVALKSTRGNNLAFTVNDRPMPDRTQLKTLLKDLASVAPESPVILDVGPNVLWGDVIDIYDICMSARFDAVFFATDANGGKQSVR